jgi:hypothetical protein
MDLIHRRSTFRREQTTETWSLDTPNQSEAIVGTEKSKIPGGCQALGVNRISMKPSITELTGWNVANFRSEKYARAKA